MKAPQLSVFKQVCSFEQAKRLNELGVAFHSLFYWEIVRQNDFTVRNELKLYAFAENNPDVKERFPGYTSCELLAVMGPEIALWREGATWCCSVNKDRYPLAEITGACNFFIVKSDSHAAEALAVMCIKLAENGMI